VRIARHSRQQNHQHFLNAASVPAAKSWPSPPDAGRLALRRKVAWFCYAPLADFYSYSAVDNGAGIMVVTLGRGHEMPPSDALA
jgi:hypothetical protein